MTDCIKTTVTEKINEDGSLTVTLNLCPVCYKCMQHVTPDIGGWIENVVQNRSTHEGDRIYRREIDKHIQSGTISSVMTKSSLILDSGIQVITESP
jgi:hypothetical protein